MRLAPLRLACERSASMKFSRTERSFSLQAFQVSTPCLSRSTCSGSAMRDTQAVVCASNVADPLKNGNVLPGQADLLVGADLWAGTQGSRSVPHLRQLVPGAPTF